MLMEKLEKLIEKVPQPVFSEEKTSNPKLPIPEVTSKIEKKSEFNASLQLRIWVGNQIIKMEALRANISHSLSLILT